jgi:DNA-3-methyladenine glycosylase II
MPNQTVRLNLEYTPPLDWPFFLTYLAVRATRGVEIIDQESYVRSVEIDGRTGTITLSHCPAKARLILTIDGDVRMHAETILCRVRRMFDLEIDLPLVHDTLRADPYMRSLIENSPGVRIPGAWSEFELLVRAIVGQQVTVKAASTIMGRIVSRFGKPLKAKHGPAFLFPSPRVIADGDMQGIGMPGKRALAIQTVARAIADDSISFPEFGGSTAGLKEALLALPGIGPWTVEYFALRALRDWDAWPGTDLVLRRAIEQLVSKGPSRRRTGAERWRPYRAYAAMHIWNSAARELT